MKKLFWLLFGTGLAIAVIAFTLSDNTLSYFFNFLLGLIITIFFAQKYIDAVETKNRKAAETNEILRHDRIMQQFILLYGKLKKKVREYDIIKQNIDSILQADRQPEREKGTERG